MAILDQNHGLTSFEICQCFDVLYFLFLSLQRRFFALVYRQRHFPGLYSIKKRLEKWQFLDQNHGLKTLEKCQFFDFLNFLFLQPTKAFFRSRISSKTFSWPILPKNKKFEKGPFFHQNHGLTPFEKCQVFEFFELRVFIAQKGVFSLQNMVKDIFLAYIAKKKSWENGHFWTKTMG